MKKLLARLLFLTISLTSTKWSLATYIPVNGSTVNIQNVMNSVTVTPGTGTWSTLLTNISTVTFNNIGQPVTSTSTYVVNLVTTTFNNIGQPVTSTSTYIINTPTITFNGVSQPVSLQNGVITDSGTFTLYTSSAMPQAGVYIPNPLVITSTTTAAVRINKYRSQYVTLMDDNNVILGTSTANPLIVNSYNQGTTTVTYNGVSQPVNTTNISTVTFNAIGQPVTSTSTYIVNLTTVSFNSVGQPVTSTSTYVVNLVTTTFNGVGQPVTSTSTVVTSTQTNNGAASGANRLNVLPGIAQNAYGNNGSAFTVGRDAAQMILSSSGLMGVWSGPDNTMFSYSASSGTFTVNNSTQDVAGLCGNANNKVFVYAIRASCTESTAGVVPVSIAKRSSAYTGSFSTMTAVPQDANYGVVQSTVQFQFGQNSTNGTLLGYLDYGQIGCMAAATATPNDIYLSPASWRMKPIVLRGTTQCVGINFQGSSLTGGKFTAAFEWIESAAP